MKVAVVGLGYWGPQLVRNLQGSDKCDEVVACDLDPNRVAEITRSFPHVTGTNKFQDLLDDPTVDAIAIATPVGTHVELATQSIRANKSVLVEKPLATSVKEGRFLIDEARKHGVLVMAGHTFLFSPAVQAVKRLIEQDELGMPVYAQSSRVNLGIHQSDVSVIWDLAPHDCSIFQYWLDEPVVKVSAQGRSSHGFGPLDVAFIDLEFASGFIANLHLSWLAPTKVRRTTLVGDKRMLVYEDTNYEEPLKLYDKGVHLPDPKDFGEFKAAYRSGDVLSPRVGTWEPLRAELDAFIDRVATGEQPDAREEAALSVVAMVEAAERSYQAGGKVVDCG